MLVFSENDNIPFEWHCSTSSSPCGLSPVLTYLIDWVLQHIAKKK